MSGALKKRASTPMRADTANVMRRMSKAALIDCLVDALALKDGVDPHDLSVASVAEFCNPRLSIRGDRKVQ